MSQEVIRLTGEALILAKTIHNLYQTLLNKTAELKREFKERLDELELDTQQQVDQAWESLIRSAGLPIIELNQWELDTSLMELGCAFLVKNDSAFFLPPTTQKH